MRYLMSLSYDGTPYHGWQRQPGDTSVQETLERALGILLRRPTALTGAGRTDTGVHARCMIAHFDTDADLHSDAAEKDRFLYRLNAIVQPSVAIHDILPAPGPEAHARFDATARTYRYLVHTVPDPFAQRSLYMHRAPDFEAMNRAAQYLLGRQDFTSFSKLHTDTKSNICTVTRARWHRYGPAHWYLSITADRFLRNMVRAVTGTLLEVGRGAAPEHVLHVLAAMDRRAAGTSMPAKALSLWHIDYPYPVPGVPLPADIW